MKRFKNNKQEEEDIWVGQSIKPGEYYEIQSFELDRWKSDQKVLDDISSGDGLMNDGEGDILNTSAALSFLKNSPRMGITLVTDANNSLVDLTSYKVLATHPWMFNRSHFYKNGVLFLEVNRVSESETISVRIVDSTNAVVLGSRSITADGFYEFSVAKPSSNAGIELQARTDNSLSSAIMKGARLEFDME